MTPRPWLMLALGLTAGCDDGTVTVTTLEVPDGTVGDARPQGDARSEGDARPVGDAGEDGDRPDPRDGAPNDAGPADAMPLDARSPAPDAGTPDRGVEPDGAEPDAAPPPPDAGPPPPDMAPLPECPAYAEAQVTGEVVDPAVVEASGVAESRRNPGVLWMHNDSGDGPRVFAVSLAGALLAIFELDGGRPRDWEDLAVGPGPDPELTYLYLGDVGDNFSRRENINVRRIPEPEVVPAEAPPTVQVEGAETFTLVYPDGAHNCETLLVDPRNGDVYVVVKSGDGVSPVFRAAAPLVADGENVMERVAELTFGPEPLRGNTNTTGGDIAPSGEAIIIRTYGSAFLWRRRGDATVGEALATEPCRIPLARERQGEALGFAAASDDYYTVSEGQNVPIHFYERQ